MTYFLDKELCTYAQKKSNSDGLRSGKSRRLMSDIMCDYLHKT